MALNRTAQLAKDAAGARRQRVIHNRDIAIGALIALALFVLLASWRLLSLPDDPQPLPPADTFVIAFRPSGQWYKAYVDPNGDFHNADDGTPLGTVTHWKYAN